MMGTEIVCLQRTPRKGRDVREESEWSETTTGMKTMMEDKSSGRRRIKAKNSTPSRYVSGERKESRVAVTGNFVC